MERVIWGQDIALDATGQARVAANGELLLTEDVHTGVQDIRLRLFTYLGSLFYDADFGSLLQDFVLEESTPPTRAALVAEVIMRVEMDPRVVTGSVRCRVLTWDTSGITAEVRWNFVDEDNPLNLVLHIDKLTKDMVVRDAKPRTDSLTPHFSLA